MVVVPLREAADAWDLVRGGLAQSTSGFLTIRGIAHSAAANNGGPVLIFTASADPDALATVRTLTALLKADLIRYEVHPVDGYSHLRDKFQVLVSGDAAIASRAVLCINCGAMVDIQNILGLDQREDDDVRVLIIDSHRPYHLRNINSDRIVLQHDSDDFDATALPVSVNIEDQWGNIPDEASSDDDDDDDDDDDGSSGSDSDSDSDVSDLIDDSEATSAQRPAKKSRLSIAENENDDDSDDADDGDESKADDDPDGGQQGDDERSVQPTTPSERKKRKKRARRENTGGEDVDDRVESYLDDVEEDDVKFDDDVEDDDDDEGGPIRKGSRKRRQPSTPDQAEKEKRRKKRARRKRQQRRRALGDENDPETIERRRLQEYYANSTMATSSACIGHGIAMLLRRANQDSLWMAILGMTSQYMTSCIDQALYDNQMAFCREEVKGLQLNGAGSGGGDGNDANESGDGEDTSAVQNVGYVPSCSGSAIQRIAQSVELRLDLLRQWNLFESLQFSSYTATRLGTWRQTGRRRLLELLATLGIPLGDSKQQWCYMLQKNKIALENHLRSAMSRFDLGDAFQFDSFVRTLPGHRGDISAADFVHAVTALLEVDDSRWHHYAAEAASPIDRFWRAYDSLDSKNVKLLEDGLDLAIFVQKLTAQIGGDVIERRKFVPSGPFRYVFLRDEQHKEFLTQPILLRRLALFLNLGLLRQGASDKPFIILSPDVGRNVWIAVAATTSSQRNDFGHRFRKAAERNGSTVTYSGFDSSVCEIKDGQEIEFVRFLHDVM